MSFAHLGSRGQGRSLLHPGSSARRGLQQQRQWRRGRQQQGHGLQPVQAAASAVAIPGPLLIDGFGRQDSPSYSRQLSPGSYVEFPFREEALLETKRTPPLVRVRLAVEYRVHSRQMLCVGGSQIPFGWSFLSIAKVPMSWNPGDIWTVEVRGRRSGARAGHAGGGQQGWDARGRAPRRQGRAAAPRRGVAGGRVIFEGSAGRTVIVFVLALAGRSLVRCSRPYRAGLGTGLRVGTYATGRAGPRLEFLKASRPAAQDQRAAMRAGVPAASLPAMGGRAGGRAGGACRPAAPLRQKGGADRPHTTRECDRSAAALRCAGGAARGDQSGVQVCDPGGAGARCAALGPGYLPVLEF